MKSTFYSKFNIVLQAYLYNSIPFWPHSETKSASHSCNYTRYTMTCCKGHVDQVYAPIDCFTAILGVGTMSVRLEKPIRHENHTKM